MFALSLSRSPLKQRLIVFSVAIVIYHLFYYFSFIYRKRLEFFNTDNPVGPKPEYFVFASENHNFFIIFIDHLHGSATSVGFLMVICFAAFKLYHWLQEIYETRQRA